MTDFRDVVRPTDRLSPPSPPEEFSRGLLDVFNDVSDALSPSAWVVEVYDIVFGFNPLEEVVQFFTGDWESFGRCADAWKNLGNFCEDIATNVAAGNRRLDSTWQSHAADTAFTYFDVLQKKIDDYNLSATELHREYMDITHAVFSGAEAVEGLLSAMADDIITSILLAEGSLLSWTGVGAAVGYGLTSVHIARILHHWGQITETISRTQNTVNAGVSAVQGSSAKLASRLSAFPLPGKAYDHPAVPNQRG